MKSRMWTEFWVESWDKRGWNDRKARIYFLCRKSSLSFSLCRHQYVISWNWKFLPTSSSSPYIIFKINALCEKRGVGEHDIIERFSILKIQISTNMEEATAGVNWFRMLKLLSFLNQHILNKFIQMKWWVKWFHTLCNLHFTCVHKKRCRRYLKIVFVASLNFSEYMRWVEISSPFHVHVSNI